MSVKVIVCGSALLLGLANLVWANESEPANELSLGLAGVFLSDHYVGDNDEALLVPLISYRTDRFSIGVLEGASYRFYDAEGLSLNMRATPRYTTLDNPDAQQLQGIDRKTTLDAGIDMKYMFGPAYVSASAVAEVTGKHDGVEVDLTIGKISEFDSLSIVYGVGISWQSKKLSNYLYGVRAADALDGRPEYLASETVAPFAEFAAEYAISQKWKAVAGGQLSILTGDNKSSPIVGSTESFGVYAGLTREF